MFANLPARAINIASSQDVSIVPDPRSILIESARIKGVSQSIAEKIESQ